MVFAQVVVLLVCGAFAPQPVDNIEGSWEGESTCTVSGSACHDEHVVYRISKRKGTPGKYTVAADKIVNDQPVHMGGLSCSYDAAKGTLRCASHGIWEYSVVGDSMTGSLKLEDGTLYRKASLHRR